MEASPLLPSPELAIRGAGHRFLWPARRGAGRRHKAIVRPTCLHFGLNNSARITDIISTPESMNHASQVSLAVFAALLIAPHIYTQSPPLQKITINYATRTGTTWPL